MNVLPRFIFFRSTATVTAFAALLVATHFVMAAEEISYDVSNSWFRPSLTVNNDPAVCGSLLNGYMNYFRSTQATNPLEANFVGKREETNSITIITKDLPEVEWETVETNDDQPLRIAEMTLNGQYYAFVRRYYSIGWREGFFNDILITKPLDEYQLPKEDQKKYFEENHFGVLAPGGEKEIFDVVYEGDSRRKNYESNIYAVIANIYTANGFLYLSLKTNKPQPDTYMVFKLLDPEKLSLTCSLQTAPTKAQIEAQYDQLPSFKALKGILFDMMGNEGNCGTLHALSNATQSLNNALDVMSYRPWPNQIAPESYYPDLLLRRQEVDASLKAWGYSGIWNYHKYKSYLSLLPKAEEEIKKFYVRNFAFNEGLSNDLAYNVLSYTLIAGFDHGRMEDEAHGLHIRILEGMSVDELRKEAISGETDKAGTESLLTFAIGRPELLKVLLGKGLNPNSQNAFGKTPLMYAAQFNDLKSAKALLERGAFTEATTIASGDTCNYTIEIKNLSALHYAVRYASRDFIKLLLDYGAPTYIADSKGNTPYDYLVKFGGFEDYKKPQSGSYGDLNQNLTPDDRKWLKWALQPLDNKKKITLSREANLKAEKLYRQGKLQEAYLSLRRAIFLNADNERALSNLSLVAYRLGRLGESVKISTKLIGTAQSDAEKANAYFNLGLACRKAGMAGQHYSLIEYDGVYYCRNDSYGPGRKRTDRSALPNFLEAYKLQPTQERLNAILGLVQDVDMLNKKRICKFSEDGSGVKSLYFNGQNLYFLIDASKEVPFKKIIGRYGIDDKLRIVTEKEITPLTDALRMERWFMDDTSVGSLMFDNMICSPAFPVAFGANTKLVEVFSSKSGWLSSPKSIRLKQGISTPVVLILYGNELEWNLEGDLSRTAGVYVHGSSTVRLPSSASVPVFNDRKGAYPDPKGSSFNQYTRGSVGLVIDSIIDVGQMDRMVLTDRLINANKFIPKSLRRP